MKLSKIHFFLPSKEDSETQTPIIYNYHKKDTSVYDQMYEQTKLTLFFQDPRPTNFISRSYMQDFNERLAYFTGNQNDDRFYPISPPPNLFQNLTVGFEVLFLDKSFVISCPGSKQFNYPYEDIFLPLFESLESGIINAELELFLEKRKIKNWENGKILCLITDNRFPNPISYKRLLSISYRAIYCSAKFGLSSKMPNSQQRRLEVEQKIGVLSHPTICTDPSPNVARAQSILDWRSKMWHSNEVKIDLKASEVQEEQILKPPETGNIELSKNEKRINIPPNIFQEFTKIMRTAANP